MQANTRYANTGAVSSAVRFDPTQTVRSYDDKFNNFGNYFQWVKDGSELSDPTWSYVFERNAVKNPVALLDLRDERAKSKSFVGNIEADYKVHGFEDLRLHVNAGADYSTGKQTLWESPAIGSENVYYGRYGFEKIDKYNLSLNAYAQYFKDFNENHHFDIMGGYEWQHFHRQGKSDYYGLYPETTTKTDDAGNSLAGTRYNGSGSNWKTEHYIVSFFGRANYTLLNRYLFTATVQRSLGTIPLVCLWLAHQGREFLEGC